jgi:hypothetical protein
VAPAAHPAPAQPAPPTPQEQLAMLRREPAEGPAVAEAKFVELETRFTTLPDLALRAVAFVDQQARQARVPFRARDVKTARRFHILDGLITLAEFDGDPNELPANLRAVLEHVDGIGTHARLPAPTLGHLVGSMNVTDAAQFADLCHRVATGTVPKHVLDDGHARFEFTDLAATTAA